MKSSTNLWRRLVDLAGLEFKGCSECVVCGGGRTLTIAVSLPLMVEWRTNGSRVMVIRTGESGMFLGRSTEEGGLLGRLGEIMQRRRRLYRNSNLTRSALVAFTPNFRQGIILFSMEKWLSISHIPI